MAAYASPTELVEWFGADELAPMATPADLGRVTPAKLRTTIAGGDRSAWPVGEVAAADAALARLQSALDDASRQIDGYLASRHTLPLAAGVVAASPLPRICGDVARWLIFARRPTEEVAGRYDRAIAWLRDVAAGRVALGGADPQAAAGAGQAVMTAKPRRGWDG